MNWYQESVEAVLSYFHVDAAHGLTDERVKQQRLMYGYNALRTKKRISWLRIFLSQFTSPLIYLLLVAAIIIFFVGDDPLDAFIISGILMFNAIIGTIQEGRTHNILESLQHFIKTKTVVVRNGVSEIIDDTDLVPGDIIVVQEGQKIPADARIIATDVAAIDESLLTGESGVVRKTEEPIVSVCPIADQNNMVWRGTTLVSGSLTAVIVATGSRTQVGKIEQSVEHIDTDIPLKKEVDQLSHYILLFILVTCISLFAIGFFSGKPIKELFVMLVALFICVIPEGLPVVLTLVLVTGAYRMAQQKVLAKNLQAVESLGRIDVIMIDKTGTLTRNEMMVSDVIVDQARFHITGRGYVDEGQLFDQQGTLIAQRPVAIETLAQAAVLLSNATVSPVAQTDRFDVVGDPTEAALLIFGKKFGITKQTIHDMYTIEHDMPFNPLLRYHATLCTGPDGRQMYLAGSPEELLSRSEQADKYASDLQQLLDKGLRVIAIGVKPIATDDTRAYDEMIRDGVTILGLVGIQDAVRTDVSDVITQVRDAGLGVIMATGDHNQTAMFIAKNVGIYTTGDRVLTGIDLDAIDDQTLLSYLHQVTVFARVSPEQKLRIVRLYQKAGDMIAMTGDGINDAPALVAADVGIAMGGIGTQVAKDASDLILLDDSFVNIIGAVEQGRHIFYTLRRVILYFFATNMGEILIVMFALIAGLPLPITAAQILWLNLVTDGFLDTALSMEPQQANLIRDHGFRLYKKLVDGRLMIKMIYMAIPMGIGSLIVFLQYLPDLAKARTMTLLAMAMYQWFNAWNCRSETVSIFQSGIFSNRWLIGATALVAGLQYAILEIPFLQSIFDTVPLSIYDWLYVFLMTMPMIVIEEIRKYIVARWVPKRN